MRERLRDRGTRRGRQHVAILADEIRNARLAAGLTQSVVAGAAGMSRAELSRIERQRAPWLDIVTAAELCAIVGLDLWLRAYAGGDPLRDAAHVALLRRFVDAIHPSLRVRTEVPIGRPGDPRAWDATVADSRDVVGVEAETRLTDAQSLERRVAMKSRDGGIDRVILVISNSRANRVALRSVRSMLRLSYPLDTDDVLAALRAGDLPAASGLVTL